MEKEFGILAFPAGHSLSPVMHLAGFKALGLTYGFAAYDVAPEELRVFMDALDPQKCGGFSVSMPHKQEIIPLLDELDEAGEAVGAVSCVYVKDEKYIGTNLDYIGVKGSLEHSEYAKEHSFEGRRIAVIGGGGAAKAAVFGLKLMNAVPVVFNRTVEKAVEIGEQFGVEAYALAEISEKIGDAEIIINCTCLGLKSDLKIIPDDVWNRMKLALDAVYSHDEPIFQREARTLGKNGEGAELLTGLDWLLHQGYEAFRIWTGEAAPQSEMEAAVREALH